MANTTPVPTKPKYSKAAADFAAKYALDPMKVQKLIDDGTLTVPSEVHHGH